MTDSADLDQLASSDANWSGSTLFAKTGHVVFSMRRVKWYTYVHGKTSIIRIRAIIYTNYGVVAIVKNDCFLNLFVYYCTNQRFVSHYLPVTSSAFGLHDVFQKQKWSPTTLRCHSEIVWRFPDCHQESLRNRVNFKILFYLLFISGKFVIENLIFLHKKLEYMSLKAVNGTIGCNVCYNIMTLRKPAYWEFYYQERKKIPMKKSGSFHISAQNHRLLVLVRTASARRF